jgi:DNA-binding transcriptional ArsR family regulator
VARNSSSAPSVEKLAAADPHDRSQEQARDILAQWRAHSLSVQSNSQADVESDARMAEVFKVLSDPTRVHMIQVLIRGEEMCVRDLSDQVEMSQSSVSHHLRILRHFRLVRARRQGREVLYSPDDPHVEMLLRVCLDHLQER